MNLLILLAAGSGSRMQQAVKDKTLVQLNGTPVFLHALKTFVGSKLINHAIIVYRDTDQKELLSQSIDPDLAQELDLSYVKGGDSRQKSVVNALRSAPPETKLVFIHDGARPLVSLRSIEALYQAVTADAAAALAHPVSDTIKRLPNKTGLKQIKPEDLERDRLWAMETPQAFQISLLKDAYEEVERSGLPVTDDTAAIAAIDKSLTIVPNPDPNPKLTTPEDLHYLEYLLSR